MPNWQLLTGASFCPKVPKPWIHVIIGYFLRNRKKETEKLVLLICLKHLYLLVSRKGNVPTFS